MTSDSDNYKATAGGGYVDADYKDTRTVNTHAWYDGAVTSFVSYDEDTGTSSNTLFDTTYTYTASGALVSAVIDDGRDRNVAWTTDMNGQVIRRDESSASAGNPHEVPFAR